MSDLSAINTLPPVVAFTANVTSGTAPLVVRFTDTSTGGVPTAWLWDFGDGIDSKHATNATHTFTKPGTYNVTLKVTNAAGNNSVTKPGNITSHQLTPTGKTCCRFLFPEAEQETNIIPVIGVVHRKRGHIVLSITAQDHQHHGFGTLETVTHQHIRNPTHCICRNDRWIYC